MVNTVRAFKPFLHKLLKLKGYQEKSIEIDPPGTTLHFWVRSESNPPSSQANHPALVLVHGFSADGPLTWQFQALSLAKHICIPDLLFFGGSTTTSPERTPAFQRDCLAEGLRQLGVKTCLVVGLSYGGMIGFEMARNHPELVVGMVVTGSVMALVESISSRSLERIGFSCWSDYLLPNTVEGVKVHLDVATYKLPWLPNFFFKHFLEETFSNRKQKTELLHALVIRDEDAPPHQFQQRIHMLWGEGDKIFTMEDANELKEKLGTTTILKSIKKGGHLVPMERPCIFNKHLKELLASYPRPPTSSIRS